MKVVFLDVDGVLHPIRGSSRFLPECMSVLEQIVKESEAVVVLTSERRAKAEQREAINDRLEVFGLPQLRGWTTKLGLAGTRVS